MERNRSKALSQSAVSGAARGAEGSDPRVLGGPGVVASTSNFNRNLSGGMEAKSHAKVITAMLGCPCSAHSKDSGKSAQSLHRESGLVLGTTYAALEADPRSPQGTHER